MLLKKPPPPVAKYSDRQTDRQSVSHSRPQDVEDEEEDSVKFNEIWFKQKTTVVSTTATSRW